MELSVERTPPFRVPAGKAGQTLLFPAGHVRSTYLSHRVGPLLHAAQRGGARDAGMGIPSSAGAFLLLGTGTCPRPMDPDS